MDVKILDVDYENLKSYISGDNFTAFDIFGATKYEDGYIFRLYAPNANRAFIRGDFSNWEDIEMYKDEEFGYFFKYIKAKEGDFYKYLLENNGFRFEKFDPYANYLDQAPQFASKIVDTSFEFTDDKWLKKRNKNFDKPLNIYEIHIGSWLKYGKNLNILDIADKLIFYIKKMGYSHIELMPLTEHPYYPSWGYQVSGFFAFTSRYGSINDLQKFINLCHKNDIGVILDFVVVHFAEDFYALKYFDGDSLYEPDYKDLQYSQWGSLNFDFSKGHVRSFMKSAINFWIEKCHLDGIRIDAVSNMIYNDGNKNRGLNKANIRFLKELNSYLDKRYPSLMKIAEDSSSYEFVTSKNGNDSLGFDYKWDLGWMNDTCKYFEIDSINRIKHQGKINFSMYYFYRENFILPLSHDEVVHLKKPMILKMNGSYIDRFKELMLLYTYQITHPGKKLNFMGNELATFDEWDENESLNWDILKFPIHDNFKKYIRSLNNLYLKNKAFYEKDFVEDGFSWKVVDDNQNSVFVYERRANDSRFLVVLNMTNTYKKSYEVSFDEDLTFIERLNNLSKDFGYDKEKRDDIKISKGENLKLELWEYEALVFEIK
ncbi:1,4-alpha-glucan branching protein GlgB [Anaerococcus sp. AGMB00486]|uniref:1,4-alpha-glucan branching enzyme n=2 Tax=Anaerococcus TaxID=165779 RepID=A0ABX2N9H7_9FIRM|nr:MULTISPECIES: 1,4-alpha-glucan branching protein GlgB [Anaerococcus]MSS78488.1 1,4-alpha-glucan branching protein GlgB [Anaerococcus porci]NVF11344.1 1,4-alpha-glucan branching protein GlgB [Anaerococcus faecalis]